MRKQLFLLAMVLAFLTGCANSEDMLDGMSNDEQVLTDEQLISTVPIRFAPSTITATVEEMPVTRTSAGNNEIINNIGMFCLGKRAINDGILEERNPSWSGKAKAIINKHSLWKNNVSVSLVVNGENKGDIVWDSPDNKMTPDYYPYYPDKDWFAYGFVAYHPRVETIVYSQATITAYIKLDGSKPVFYAMAKEPLADLDDATKNLAFSKSYYEQLDPEPGVEKFINPYFEFEYLTSALNFYFYSKTAPQTNLHIDKVEFDQFPCIMYLGLANLRRYANKKAYDMASNIKAKPFIVNEDKLQELNLTEQFPEMTSAFGHFELYEADGTSISEKKNADGSYKYTLTEEKQKVGGSLYIPPVYSGHSKEELKIYITVADDAGNKYKCQSPVKVKTKTGWKKAASYDIPIWLDNPAEVAKDASLAEWVAAEPIEVNATLTNWVQQP